MSYTYGLKITVELEQNASRGFMNCKGPRTWDLSYFMPFG